MVIICQGKKASTDGQENPKPGTTNSGDGVKMFFDGANQGLLKGSILSHKNVLAHRKVFQGEQNLSFLAARQSH